MKNNSINIISVILLFYSSVICQTNLITGIVIDSTKREPIISARIIIEPGKLGTITDVYGKYKFENLQVGTYKFICRFIGYDNYIDSIKINDTTLTLIKNIEMRPIVYPPAVFKDTTISGYYNSGFEYSIIKLCGKSDEIFYLEPIDSLKKLHRELSQTVKEKLSSYGLAEVFVTVSGKMQIRGTHIHINCAKYAFIVEDVLEIKLPSGNECNNK